MISKAAIKRIHALEKKKFRDESGLFIAEGDKTVSEFMSAFECTLLVATSNWLAQHTHLQAAEIVEVTQQELESASLLKSPQQVLAVFKQRVDSCNPAQIAQQLNIALDDVQDPGNLGTIVRIADWFGIHDIFCSWHTADVYNPKTIQATMGALARVRVHYVDLPHFLTQYANSCPIYGTLLNGKNMYQTTLENRGIVVMGNEGNGISPEIRKLISQALYIPSYPAGAETSESLNVAIATAVVCAEFRRGR